MVPIKKSKKSKKHPKHTTPPAAPNLSGTWRYPLILQKVNDQYAIQMGLTANGGKTALPHGTYTDNATYTIITSDQDSVGNAILDIFDEQGNFCRFVWNGVDTWNSVPDPIAFEFAGDPNASPPLLAAKIARYPTLLLAPYDPEKGPWNICPKGPSYISVSGDGTTPNQLPDQCITQKDKDSFVWHLGKDWGTKPQAPNDVEFSQAAPQPPMPASFDSFGKVFVAQSGLAQLDFPYYGFDPRFMDIFSLTGTNSGSGTGTSSNINKPHAGNPLNLGALIFNYPEEDSTDYVQGSDLGHQPYLPLGTTGVFIEKVTRDSTNQMVSTMADMSHSWSTTLGLSGGVEGLMNLGGKATYGSTIEQQQKNESRFTITRNYGIYWTCLIDKLSMTMTDEFLLKINDQLTSLLEGQALDWTAFVSDFGTHFLYAMVQGDMEYSLTEFTFETQVKATSNHVDISTVAQDIIEGATVKTETDFKNELKNKLQTDFSNEITHYIGIGTPGTPGVGIFFDLRSLTELMSPIFFPYDPDDDKQKLSPWIWYNLRQSFSDYLTSQGLNKPLDPSFVNDYTPHVIKLTIPSIVIEQDSDDGYSPYEGHKLYITGTLSFQDWTDADQASYKQMDVENITYKPQRTRVDNVQGGSGYNPKETEIVFRVAVIQGHPVYFMLQYDFAMTTEDNHGVYASFQGTLPVSLTWKPEDKSGTVSFPSVDAEGNFSNVANVIYTLKMGINWEDTGALGVS